ncbi:MAG: mechanosensitive ion channel family protein [Gammaproteobacteria bacterium]
MKKSFCFGSATFLAAILLLTFSSLLPANEADESVPATGEAAAEEIVIPEFKQTPRAALTHFLKVMQAAKNGDSGEISSAIDILDLGDVNPLIRIEKGSELAWTLLNVLERAELTSTRGISQRKEGDPANIGEFEGGNISIAYSENGGWQFSKETLTALPEILDELSESNGNGTSKTIELTDSYLPLSVRIRQAMPAKLKKKTFALEHWQWIGILITILIGFVLDKFVSLLLRLGVRSWKARMGSGAYQEVDSNILRPLGLMAMAMVWWTGLNITGLPPHVLVVLLVSVKFLTCLSAVWSAYRLVDLLRAFLMDKAQATQSKLDDALVPLLTKTVKVFVTVMGVIFIAENLDVDVTSLLAGLGLGGLAFALAAKDVAGNLFGSVTVLLDQTFHVGDWVVIGDVEGTVEKIGFRSTRIRTFYNSVVSVPNSGLITTSVDNMGKREFRRLSCKLSIAYDTPPDRIEAFCEGIREIVRLHPYMRKDNFHVYLNEMGAASLNILIYVFWKTPNWATELRERHRFLLDCLRLAKRLGVEYAFPTQTIHMIEAQPGPPEAESGEFTPPITEKDAKQRGLKEAREIVRQTTGLDHVPPPVILGEKSGDKDGE